MADNKWTKPTNPPPPLFLGRAERNLVKQVNDELLERVIGQQILYMPVSMDYTNFHPIYGEAIESMPLLEAFPDELWIRQNESHYCQIP